MSFLTKFLKGLQKAREITQAIDAVLVVSKEVIKSVADPALTVPEGATLAWVPAQETAQGPPSLVELNTRTGTSSRDPVLVPQRE